MNILITPVLGFRGRKGNLWHLSLLTMRLDHENPVLTVPEGCQLSGPVQLAENKGRILQRHDVVVTLGAQPRTLAYEWRGASYEISLPAAEGKLRFAYASCNGFSSPAEMKGIRDPYNRWKHLRAQHQIAPCHCLLLGGDQVYSDSIWFDIPELKAWSQLSEKKKAEHKWKTTLQKKVADFYFDLYCDRWSLPEIGAVLARIPSVMMWDDHDIFDGWGSYPAERQQTGIYQGIFQEADKAFLNFQLQAGVSSDLSGWLGAPGSYTQGMQMGDVALGVMDLRSERTPDQVMSPGAWNRFFEWMDGLTGCKHLLLMSSIPVIYPDFHALEGLLGFLPGQQELEDDLKDHWCSRSHQGERVRLLHRLLDFSKKSRCRVTLLSGDVHVAALGILESKRDGMGNSQVINQLIASAIIHPPPPMIALVGAKLLAEKVEEVDRGIAAWMATFPGTDVKFIPRRNWLSLTVDPQDRIWAEWWAEAVGDKEDAPYSKVIHPCKEA